MVAIPAAEANAHKPRSGSSGPVEYRSRMLFAARICRESRLKAVYVPAMRGIARWQRAAGSPDGKAP